MKIIKDRMPHVEKIEGTDDPDTFAQKVRYAIKEAYDRGESCLIIEGAYCGEAKRFFTIIDNLGSLFKVPIELGRYEDKSGRVLELHINFLHPPDQAEEKRRRELEADELVKNLLRSIDDLELGVRAYNCLYKNNWKCVGDVVQRTEVDLLRMKNFGRHSLNELKKALRAFGLAPGMKLREDYGIDPVTLKRLNQSDA